MKLPERIVYAASVTVAVMGALTLYLAWWWHTFMAVPELAAARIGFYRQDVPVRSVLLWQETLVRAPSRGSVQYRHGTQGAFVAKGEALASVLKGGKSRGVTANDKGYFVPGLDGLEGKWRYSSLWTGSLPLPQVPDLKVFSDFSEIRLDRVIGKFIPQPQDLRCIAYCPLTDKISSDIKKGRLEFRLDPLETPFSGKVRVVKSSGKNVKLYMDLPFFPLEAAFRREMTLYINGGEWRGAEIPQSALDVRTGRKGVYVIRGDRAFFREVQGIPMDGDKFLVQTGLNPGNLVLLNGMAGQEGRIRLW